MSVRPILILGVPRSGTRLVSRILGRIPGTILTTEHDNKSKIPEDRSGVSDSSVWRSAFEFKHGRAANGMPLCEEPIPSQDGERRIREHYAALASQGRLIVKNPQHLARLDILDRVLPNFLPVWVIRHPNKILDSVLRSSEQRFLFWTRRHASALHAHRFQLRTEACMRIDPLDTAARVAHGLGFMADRFKENPGCTVYYENLISSPKVEIARLYDAVHADVSPEVATDIPRRTRFIANDENAPAPYSGAAGESVGRYFGTFLYDPSRA